MFWNNASTGGSRASKRSQQISNLQSTNFIETKRSCLFVNSRDRSSLENFTIGEELYAIENSSEFGCVLADGRHVFNSGNCAIARKNGCRSNLRRVGCFVLRSRQHLSGNIQIKTGRQQSYRHCLLGTHRGWYPA